MAGLADVLPGVPDISFMTADAARFGLKAPYVLLAPGGAAHPACGDCAESCAKTTTLEARQRRTRRPRFTKGS